MKFNKLNLPRIVNHLFRGILSIAALTFVLILAPAMAHALMPVTVAWDENIPVPSGYILYWGTSSGNYTSSHDAGSATQCTIPDLQEGVTYYFAAKAYDGNGNESAFSQEISHKVALTTHTISTSAETHGSITPGGSVVVNDGESKTFVITPDQDYQILEVRVDGALIGTATSYTFNNVDQDHTISASFVYVDHHPVDSDGDGVSDAQDAFPQDPSESTDTDNDGTGNNADLDDDGDGMPDSWEISNDLNPLLNDADSDPDGDGVTNYEEYQAGTSPYFHEDNSAPYAPALLKPMDNEIVSLTPVLTTEEFYDPDIVDFHAKSRWQIVRRDDGSIVFDQTSDKSLTSIAIPKLVLDENTTYEWQIQFIDNHGATSEWSQTGIFLTDFNQDDSDANGIPDHQEVDASIDLDKDGIPDIDQDDIKCVYVEDKAVQIGVSIKNSTSIQSIETIESENSEHIGQVSNSFGKPEYLPFGLLNFKLIVDRPGDEVEVTIYLSEPAPFNAIWYKYDPVNMIWQDYSEYTDFSADRQSVYLILKDGGFGDADGTENGIIIDPVGLGVSSEETAAKTSDSDSSGSSSGCFISAANHSFTDGTIFRSGKKSVVLIFNVMLLTAVLLVLLKSDFLWANLMNEGNN